MSATDELPSIRSPWETYSDQAQREARERENGNARWTEELLFEVRQRVRGYEDDLDKGWCERLCAVHLLITTYKLVPLHLRGEIFGAKSIEVIE